MLKHIVLVGALAAAALPGAARAGWPVHGIVDFSGSSIHPNSGSSDPGTGYSITPAFSLTENLYLFTGYSHGDIPAKAPGRGSAVSDTYSVAVKYLYVQSPLIRWLPAITCYDAHRSAAGVDSTTRGHDLAFGLRLEASGRLELIADLHHTDLGTVYNNVTLGFLYRLSQSTAAGAFYNRGISAGREDHTATALLRLYF